MFEFFKNKNSQALNLDDNAIVSMADGKIIDISKVPDEMFATKMLGESIAFNYGDKKTTICAPANGELTVLFPTGHSFGIKMNNGVELLVHIGIDTVNARGDGFRILNVKQGEIVKAGQEIVEVDFKKLSEKYDTSVMLIVTNDNDKNINFITPQSIKKGQTVII